MFKQDQKLKNGRGGYIALMSLLIIAAAGLTIAISTSLASIEQVQLSFAGTQAARAGSAAQACLEDGLERLRQNWSDYSGSLSIGSESCIINTVIAGSNATLVAIGTIDIYNQKIQIQVDNNLDVINWQEE